MSNEVFPSFLKKSPKKTPFALPLIQKQEAQKKTLNWLCMQKKKFVISPDKLVDYEILIKINKTLIGISN